MAKNYLLEYSEHKAVIEILFRRVEAADRPDQQFADNIFELFAVAGENGLLYGNSGGLRDHILKLLQDLLAVNKRYLLVRQSDLAHKVTADGNGACKLTLRESVKAIAQKSRPKRETSPFQPGFACQFSLCQVIESEKL